MSRRWSGADLPLSERDRTVWERAEEQIRRVRFGDLRVTVVNRDGSPLANVPVTYEQLSHTWRQGIHYPCDPSVLDLMQGIGINAISVWLGWKHLEPLPAVFNWGYLDAVWQPLELRRRKLAVSAQALFWGHEAWRVMPDYLLHERPGDLPHRVYELMSQVALRWGEYIDTYELVNEPFWLGANALGLDLEGLVRACQAAALGIREHQPEARLMVSFAEVSRMPSYKVHPLALLDALDKKGVPVDVVGLQCFENGFSLHQPATYYRCKTLGGIVQTCKQYTRAGKPIHVMTAVPSSGPATGQFPSQFAPAYGDWDLNLQANYADALYTMLAAMPEVEGLTWWAPVDGRLAYIHQGGLLTANLEPKPVFMALAHWMDRYTSNGQVYTDGGGRVILTGAAGEYQVAAGLGAERRALVQRIRAGGSEPITIVLGAD